MAKRQKKATRSAATTRAKRTSTSRTKRASTAAKKKTGSASRKQSPARAARKPATAKAKRPASTAAKTAKKADMVVVVAPDRPAAEVAGELKSAGFEVGEVLHAINQVTGRAAPALKSRLRGIRGVEDVSEAHPDFDIGPPDAPVS